MLEGCSCWFVKAKPQNSGLPSHVNGHLKSINEGEEDSETDMVLV